MLRKCIGLIVTVALVVSVSAVSVGAVDATGAFTGRFVADGYGNGNFTVNIPRTGNKGTVFNYDGVAADREREFTLLDFYYNSGSSESIIGGSVGLYFSWCGAASVPGSYRVSSKPSAYRVSYSIGNTSTFVTNAEATRFNFSSGVMDYPGEGYQLSCRLEDIDSLTDLTVNFNSSFSGNYFFTPASLSGTYNFKFFIPSASLVYTESSAQLDTLEGIADEIAAGNAIAQAMYGDIMEALNAISGDTELMASYINDCLTYLAAIDNKTLNIYNLCSSYLHNLADIARTAEDIEAELSSFHSDFMSKMDLLIGTITSESDDIQATMDRIYEQLIAWLETNFKEAISPEFEGSNSDLNQGIQNNDAIEQEWTGSLSDTWSAMHIADFTFDSSFTSGFMWVSGWFSNIYNSLGLYGSIVILPLIIGICKLLLGYFRFAGHGHSKGGGDVGA